MSTTERRSTRIGSNLKKKYYEGLQQINKVEFNNWRERHILLALDKAKGNVDQAMILLLDGDNDNDNDNNDDIVHGGVISQAEDTVTISRRSHKMSTRSRLGNVIGGLPNMGNDTGLDGSHWRLSFPDNTSSSTTATTTTTTTTTNKRKSPPTKKSWFNEECTKVIDWIRTISIGLGSYLVKPPVDNVRNYDLSVLSLPEIKYREVLGSKTITSIIKSSPDIASLYQTIISKVETVSDDDDDEEDFDYDVFEENADDEILYQHTDNNDLSSLHNDNDDDESSFTSFTSDSLNDIFTNKCDIMEIKMELQLAKNQGECLDENMEDENNNMSLGYDDEEEFDNNLTTVGGNNMKTAAVAATTTTAEAKRQELLAAINHIQDNEEVITPSGPVPALKSKFEALSRVRSKLGIQNILDDTNIPQDTKIFITKIESIIVKYISYLYDEGILQGHQWTESKIKTDKKTDNAALYVLRAFGTNIIEKAGQSLRVNTRVGQQKDNGNAYQVFNVDQLLALVPQRFVDEILAAAPPSLKGDKEQIPRQNQMVRNHIVELVVAASRSVRTWPAGERLVELPSKKIRKLLRPPSKTDRTSIAKFFGQFDFKGVHIFGTWITLRSYLEDIARTGNAFLRSKLRTPPTHQFLTKLMFYNMWTEKYILSFEDAVSIPPIYKKINELLLPFKERLEAGNKEDLNEEFYAALRHVLLKFEKGGEFEYDYMRPEDVDLAVGMMGLFKKTVADRTITHDELIVLEYSGFDMLFSQEETKAWAKGFFDITNLYIGKHNSNCVLCLFTYERHPVMVHVSHFEIFAENQSTTTRYNNGQALYQQYYYLQDAQIITDTHAINERAKIQAAMMRINASDNDNGDEDVEGGGYREARVLYSPEGYFLTSKKYIICVSKNMGSGMKANILLGIAYFLGETPMKRILVNVYGMSAETPLYVKSFRCPGLLETESRPGRPCATDVVGLDEDL